MSRRGRSARTLTFASLMMAGAMLVGGPGQALADQQDEIDAIEEEMLDIRGLEQQEEVQVTFMDREALQDDTSGDLEDEYPEEEQEIDERVLLAFGLIDEGDDIGDMYVIMYGGQVAGYYDPATKELVLVSDSTNDSELTASDKVTFSHEFVHALQDQNFDLGRYIDLRIAAADDQSMAVTSLIEGDATAAEIEYLSSKPDLIDEYLEEVEDQSGESDIDEVAPILVDTLYFPYDQGYEFVNALLEEGGWDLVNESYANPPTSTEQILHPEKYLDGDDPVACDIVDVPGALGEDWEVFDINTMGEFQISILLDDGDLSKREAERAAEGWGGDSYVVAGNEDSEVIYWATTWDDDDEAEEFLDALIERESERLEADADTDDGVTVIEGDDAVVQIIADGEDVTYIYGPDLDTVEELADADSETGAEILPLEDSATPEASFLTGLQAVLPGWRS